MLKSGYPSRFSEEKSNNQACEKSHDIFPIRYPSWTQSRLIRKATKERKLRPQGSCLQTFPNLSMTDSQSGVLAEKQRCMMPGKVGCELLNIASGMSAADVSTAD